MQSRNERGERGNLACLMGTIRETNGGSRNQGSRMGGLFNREQTFTYYRVGCVSAR